MTQPFDFNIRQIPTKVSYDWMAVAKDVTETGRPWYGPAHIDPNAAHACLHRKGVGVRAVKNKLGEVIAYRFDLIKPQERKKKP